MRQLISGVSQAMRPILVGRVVNYFPPHNGARRMRARAVQAITGSFMGSIAAIQAPASIGALRAAGLSKAPMPITPVWATSLSCAIAARTCCAIPRCLWALSAQ